MTTDIDFYFDFASPYAYLAANRIDQLAATHGRKVRWIPVLITALCQATGSPLAPLLPLKWNYVRRDLERVARASGIPYRLPPSFPRLLLEPGRAMTWIANTHGQELAAAFARICFQAYFSDGVDIGDVQVVAGIAGALGVDQTALLAGMADPAIKQQFKQSSELALEQGVFGVPFVIADGESFWGFDRFGLLEAALARATAPQTI